MGNTSSSVRSIDTSTETTNIWRYKIHLSGRGVRASEYTYVYVSPVDNIVIEPGNRHPIRAYEVEEWRDIDNEKKLVPVRVSLLRAASAYLEYENQITNEIQRQLAVN
jgi:hypothetical protein